MPQLLQRVFVTGASGFVGGAVVGELLSRGHEVVALVRRRSALAERECLHIVEGDLLEVDGWDDAIAGCHAIVHLVGIIREIRDRGVTFERLHVEATRRMLAAAVQAGVERFVHMSALGSRRGAATAYHRTKWAAEERVRQSDLAWTIFRPALIYGPRGEFTRMALQWAAKKVPLMPYFGGGVLGLRQVRFQPVFVGDVARAFVDAVGCEASFHKSYDVAGPDELTWPAFYRVLAWAAGHHRVIPVAVPAWFARATASLLPEKLLPFTRDQVTMAMEKQPADNAAFESDFGWRPRALREVPSELLAITDRQR